ncbi:hypothetical protein [Segetibacter koreensis]|uniref:hypothetical protein n=1 Tax=Segetibacter koreensis TaxID=398037 RepID=UPI000375B076|nr:hypothetical protein [Segetibacter koreensis]
MKKVLVFISLAMMLYVSSCYTKDDKETTKNGEGQTVQPAPGVSKQDKIQRGEYLVNVIGCGDCHAPKKMTEKGPAPDMDRYLSGFNSTQPMPKFDTKVMQRDQVAMFNPELTAAAGPWGVSFAANLTPDETGIGNWTLDNFKRALKQGKYKGLENSRDLLPPMPWTNFKNLKDDDVESIFLYLKSLKPVSNRVPDAIPPAGTKS